MRMDLLAQGMGVDSPLPLNLEREDSIRESGGILGGGFGVVGVGLGMSDVVGFGDGLKREVLDPRSAEEWIMRQGDGGLLLC